MKDRKHCASPFVGRFVRVTEALQPAKGHWRILGATVEV